MVMHIQRRATALDVWCCDDEEDGCGSTEAALDDALFGFDEDVLDDAFCLDVELPSNRVLWPCWRSLDAFMRRQNHEGKQAWETKRQPRAKL